MLELIVAVFLAFLAICVGILFISDCDIWTYLHIKFGKDIATRFEGKVVWVTGASSGIGEGIAKELVKVKNVKIILSARRNEELERVKRECLALNNSTKQDAILVLPFDMVDYDSHAKALEKVVKTFGKLDILISNAAAMGQFALWEEAPISTDKALFDLNVFSLVNLNRIVLNYFKNERGRQGHLAVVSSLAGKMGFPYLTPYTPTKFALHGYFDSLRHELRKMERIHVTLLCPGPVETNIYNDTLTGTGARFKLTMMSTLTRNAMTTARCGEICLASIANKLEESWMGPLPNLPFMYLAAYQPFLFSKLTAYTMKFMLLDEK
ncbi:dehydrogenase/reductase SDR family member 7 isoform X1 [Folsomia candida]|uniref:Dehydrogenase/reductase SDR family member 7 n=2 Tax=Folsomia candida TaxID=158441 RepID=A0A226DCA0_FOLCA|nr:dehydrogenase/reductase SDR family member 7 isoform X1 [Folsomia candida]OXA43142.1 Dehydrogenase/reductase SDR family member 7 [Folsomia candida]